MHLAAIVCCPGDRIACTVHMRGASLIPTHAPSPVLPLQRQACAWCLAAGPLLSAFARSSSSFVQQLAAGRLHNAAVVGGGGVWVAGNGRVCAVFPEGIAEAWSLDTCVPWGWADWQHLVKLISTPILKAVTAVQSQWKQFIRAANSQQHHTFLFHHQQTPSSWKFSL